MHLIHTDTCHTASIHTHIHILHLANFSVIYQYIQIQTDIHKIHTDTCHTVHIHTHMHISHLANFKSASAPASRPAAQWGGSDGRADSDNRAVTTSAVAASRAGKFTAWKSQKELVRSAGRAKRRRAGSSRFALGNRQCNHKSTTTNPCDVSILSDQEKAT